MFKNYIMTAYRNLIKTIGFSTINIVGLTIGMTAFLLLLHYVRFEKSYDRFHPNKERIYRLRVQRTTGDGQATRFASCAPPAGDRLKQGYPEIEKVARIFKYRAGVSVGDIKFLEERIFFAEPEFFEIFSFSFLRGDPVSHLKNPGNAFISESTANRYFGEVDPIGKTFSVDKKTDYQIVGIFKDCPAHSHIKFDFLLPMENLFVQFGPEYYEAWGHTGMYTYLRMKPNADLKVFNQKLQNLVNDEFGEVLKGYNIFMELKMQPLTDIHLTSHFMQEFEVNGNRDTVRFLLVIAFLILVMAWVNYINLSTARSLTRAKEVGLRKVVGATRSKIMIQFFIETFLINGIALLCTLLLVVIAIPFFSRMTGIPADAPLLSRTSFWSVWIFLLFTGVAVSGAYPVLVMSSFKPASVLHGKLGGSPKKVNLRKGLVVFQFVIALILLAATQTIFRQIQFMQKQNLRVNIRQTLVVRAPRVRNETYGDTWKTFKETLLKDPNIQRMSHVTEVPGRQIYWDAGGIHKAGEDQNKGKNYQIVGIDYDFIPLFDLKLVSGRNFSLEYSTDSEGLILNETAVRIMGFENPQEAIGQQVDYWGNLFTIIGVLKDFHQQSPKEAFEPHLYRLMLTGRDIRGMFAVKIHNRDIKKTVQLIHKQYDRFFPGNPFDFFFLDDYYNKQYQADQLLGKVFGVFSGLAVVITALGILGLSSFSAVQRTKEIGIRKVMGASVGNILFLLIRDFLILIGVSFCLSLPVLIFGIDEFLKRYAFRIRMEGWLFILPLLGVIIITLLTVSTHIVKSATANPARALRYE